MTATKERIIGAVSLMNDKEAEFFWKMIQSPHSRASRMVLGRKEPLNTRNVAWPLSFRFGMRRTVSSVTNALTFVLTLLSVRSY